MRPLVAVAHGNWRWRSVPGPLGALESAGGALAKARGACPWSARSDDPEPLASSGCFDHRPLVGAWGQGRAIVALTLYACCPWCGGFSTGLTLVPQGLEGGANGPGAQRAAAPFWRVEVPGLALPVLMARVRVAMGCYDRGGRSPRRSGAGGPWRFSCSVQFATGQQRLILQGAVSGGAEALAWPTGPLSSPVAACSPALGARCGLALEPRPLALPRACRRTLALAIGSKAFNRAATAGGTAGPARFRSAGPLARAPYFRHLVAPSEFAMKAVRFPAQIPATWSTPAPPGLSGVLRIRASPSPASRAGPGPGGCK